MLKPCLLFSRPGERPEFSKRNELHSKALAHPAPRGCGPEGVPSPGTRGFAEAVVLLPTSRRRPAFVPHPRASAGTDPLTCGCRRHPQSASKEPQGRRTQQGEHRPRAPSVTPAAGSSLGMPREERLREQATGTTRPGSAPARSPAPCASPAPTPSPRFRALRIRAVGRGKAVGSPASSSLTRGLASHSRKTAPNHGLDPPRKAVRCQCACAGLALRCSPTSSR